jgi:phosphoglycerate dehydrogenase-like enzyme
MIFLKIPAEVTIGRLVIYAPSTNETKAIPTKPRCSNEGHGYFYNFGGDVIKEEELIRATLNIKLNMQSLLLETERSRRSSVWTMDNVIASPHAHLNMY